MNQFKTFSIIVALLLGMSGCDNTSFLDQPKSDQGSSSTRISAALPEGYVYDGSRHAYRAPAGINALAAPSYVTAVRLRVSGEGIDPRTIDVPLDTLAVIVSVTYGERTFGILVETKSGVTFTGAKKVTIDAATPSEVVIPLEINAPPVIDRIDVSHTNPKPGDTLVLTAFASDPDPDDTLLYSWRGISPDGVVKTASGQSVSFVIPPIAGDYRAIVTVTDGHGGSASKTGTVTVDYAKPAIRGVKFGGTLYEGNTISATVDLFQLLTGYTIQWQFTKPDNTKVTVTGATVTLNNAAGGKYSYTVKVTDAYGASATYSGTFNVDCPQVTATTTVTVGNTSNVNGRLDVSWTALTNAKSYYAKVYSGGALQRTDTGLTGTTKAMTEPVGQMRGYAVGGADCLGRQGPVSTTSTEIATPGIHQPLNLGESGSTTGTINLWWTTDTGPVTPATAVTGYTMRIVNNASGIATNVNNASGATTCPGGAPWNGGGQCNNYAHNTCTTGTSYTYTVTETDGTFTSDASAAFTFTCP